MLAGDARDALIASRHHAVDRADAAAPKRAQLGGRIQVGQQVIQVAPQLAQDVGDRPSVAGQDRRPQARIGGRDTRRVTQPLPRQTECLRGSINEARRQHRRHELRHVGHQGHRVIVRARIHLQGHRAHVRGKRTRGQHRTRPRQLMGHDHPRPTVEQVGVGRAGAGALASSHRV